jgi:hypothetical protein
MFLGSVFDGDHESTIIFMKMYKIYAKNIDNIFFESMAMLDGVMDRLLRTQGYPYSIGFEDRRVPL